MTPTTPPSPGSSRPLPISVGRCPTCRPNRRTRARRSPRPARRCRAGCISGRSRWPRSTSSPATSSRSSLAQRYDVDLDAEPFDVYRVLRQVNPSPYMYFVRHPEMTIVGSSPEPMVQLLGGTVISRPIAGTRKRGTTDEHDRRLAAELTEHPKERAEHVMLVDLARNDVGRVADYGTVHVDELMTLERYSHVMHLTSQVSGSAARGPRADRRAAGHAARRHGVGRPEGAGDGDHRRPRAGQARSVRGRRRLPRLVRQPRHRHRHPHDVRGGAGHGAPGRGRHRGRLGPRRRGPRVPQQGRRPAGRHPAPLDG